MAKIVTSKSSGKRYLQLEQAELTEAEQDLVLEAQEANKAKAIADKALRDMVLARTELQGHGFNQVYVTYGGAVKIGKGEATAEKTRATAKPLAAMLAEYAADGFDA
jgi:hypothetical protein